MSEVINRFERDHVELVDKAAVDTVAMIQGRLEELEADIAEDTAARGDVTGEIERLQAQIEWLSQIIDEKKRVVELATKAEDTKSVRMPFRGDVYGILLGRHRGNLVVRGWDEPDIRVNVTVRAYDEEPSAARARVDKVQVHVDGDAARAARLYDPDRPTRAQVEESMRFRHSDPRPILDSLLDGPDPVLSVEIADNPSVSVEYGGRRWMGESVEIPSVEVFVPPMKTLRIVASEARIENVRADVEVITYRGVGTFTDITGDLSVMVRSCMGGRFVGDGTTHSARRIECDGDVTIARVGGDVSVETDNAPVRLREIEGTIRARTMAGDIEWIRTHETGTSMRLESDWGTIHAEHAAIDPQSDDWKWWGRPDPLYAGTGTPDETLDARIQLFSVVGNVVVTNAD